MRWNFDKILLSSIISSLEQIKNNQYTLYQEITMANATVNEIVHELRDIKKDTKLNTYFAGVTALAAVSPKVYIGRTF